VYRSAFAIVGIYLSIEKIDSLLPFPCNLSIKKIDSLLPLQENSP